MERRWLAPGVLGRLTAIGGGVSGLARVSSRGVIISEAMNTYYSQDGKQYSHILSLICAWIYRRIVPPV